MTTTNQSPRPDAPRPEPGYRGSLPTRDDRLARPWILVVLGIFALVLVLSVAGLPSRLFPEPSPVPLPSTPISSTSAEPAASSSVEPSASVAESPSPSPSPSGS